MIYVNLIKQKDSVIGFECNGHANSDVFGKDLICAGVSSIITGGFNALRDEDISECYLEDGYAKVTLKNVDCYSKVVLDTMITQLSTIEEEFPKNIKIK